jgi:HEAT repeat protein
MDEENSGAVLAALKNDPDSSVRAAAASVLGTLRTQTAVDALSDALKDPAWNVRGAAALSLGQVGGEKGISTLSRALNDVYEAFADFAGDALKKKQGTASAETPTEDTDAEHTGGDDAPASG